MKYKKYKELLEISKWKSLARLDKISSPDMHRIAQAGIPKPVEDMIQGLDIGANNILNKYDIKQNIISRKEFDDPSRRKTRGGLGSYNMYKNTAILPDDYHIAVKKHEADEGAAANKILDRYFDRHGEYPLGVYVDNKTKKYEPYNTRYTNALNIEDIPKKGKQPNIASFPYTHMAPSVIKKEKQFHDSIEKQGHALADKYRGLNVTDDNKSYREIDRLVPYVDYHKKQYERLNNLDSKTVRKFERDRLRKLKRISDVNKELMMISNEMNKNKFNFDIMSHLKKYKEELLINKTIIEREFSDKWNF